MNLSGSYLAELVSLSLHESRAHDLSTLYQRGHLLDAESGDKDDT